MEDKTRANDRGQEKQPAEAEGVLAPAPPLLVTLLRDVGKLPGAGRLIIYQFPNEVALGLIQHRYAVPVASFGIEPDLVIDEEQLQYTGLGDEFIPLELSVAPALAAA